MPATDYDVIDSLAGIGPGSALAAIRARRPETRTHAQASYDALFAPAAPGDVTLAERFAVASFVAGLHHAAEIAAFYTAGLATSGDAAVERGAVEVAIAAGTARGPYGNYPPGPLSGENKAGPVFRVDAETAGRLGPRLTAAFEHTHMLVFHPRDADAPSLQALLDAGWSTTGIVTLSQLVAFLSFQIRTVAGLRALGATSERRTTP